jgi:hypothetical protein
LSISTGYCILELCLYIVLANVRSARSAWPPRCQRSGPGHAEPSFLRLRQASPLALVLMTDVTISGSLYHKSPLDTLVRQSSRRAQTNNSQLQPVSTFTRHRQGMNGNPSSPLLHTRFRTSASTGSSSFVDLPDDEGDTNTPIQPGPSQGSHSSWPGDDESVYSRTSGSRSPTPSVIPEHDRQSWASHSSDATMKMELSTQPARDTWRSSSNGVDPFSFRQYESPTRGVPMVVVSSPTASVANSSVYDSPGSSRSMAPRPSATQYSISNFSRPLRYPPTHNGQGNKEVLDRSHSPHRPVNPQQQFQHELSSQKDEAAYPTHRQQTNYYNASSHSALPSMISDNQNPYMSEPDIFGSPVANTAQSTVSDAVPSGIARSTSPIALPDLSSQPIRLPNSPPSPRPTSRASLYSAYSFYQLDDGSRTPSPSSPNYRELDYSSSKPVSAPSTDPSSDPLLRPRASPSPKQSPPSTPTPDDYLYLGIQHHEANRLAESAICFERAATIDGGCGTGMLMWGLTLRHAWGTPKDEKAAFRWLRRAAEAAVGDLEAARNGVDQKAVKVR